MAVCSISVVPIGTGDTSVSPFVAECQKVLENNKKIKYRLTPMATVLEGEMSDLLDAVSELHAVPFRKGALRVMTTLMIDERRDRGLTMEGKIRSVRDRLK